MNYKEVVKFLSDKGHDVSNLPNDLLYIHKSECIYTLKGQSYIWYYSCLSLNSHTIKHIITFDKDGTIDKELILNMRINYVYRFSIKSKYENIHIIHTKWRVLNCKGIDYPCINVCKYNLSLADSKDELLHLFLWNPNSKEYNDDLNITMFTKDNEIVFIHDHNTDKIYDRYNVIDKYMYLFLNTFNKPDPYIMYTDKNLINTYYIYGEDYFWLQVDINVRNKKIFIDKYDNVYAGFSSKKTYGIIFDYIVPENMHIPNYTASRYIVSLLAKRYPEYYIFGYKELLEDYSDVLQLPDILELFLSENDPFIMVPKGTVVKQREYYAYPICYDIKCIDIYKLPSQIKHEMFNYIDRYIHTDDGIEYPFIDSKNMTLYYKYELVMNNRTTFKIYVKGEFRQAVHHPSLISTHSPYEVYARYIDLYNLPPMTTIFKSIYKLITDITITH